MRAQLQILESSIQSRTKEKLLGAILSADSDNLFLCFLNSPANRRERGGGRKSAWVEGVMGFEGQPEGKGGGLKRNAWPKRGPSEIGRGQAEIDQPRLSGSWSKTANNAILWASGILVAEVPWPRAEAFFFSHVPKPLRGGGADLGGSTPPINISLSEAEAKQWGQ